MHQEVMGDFTIKFSYDREPTEEEQDKINKEKDKRKKETLTKHYSRGHSLYQSNYPYEYGEGLFEYIRNELAHMKGLSLGVLIQGHHQYMDI